MSLARSTATRSKDPVTQVGCVLVDPVSRTMCSAGYNGMVRGVLENAELWGSPIKYTYVCHAEANAVAIAARHGIRTLGCTAYVTCFPCMACARLLIQAGIKHIIVLPLTVSSGYLSEYEEVMKLLEETETKCNYATCWGENG